MDHHDNPGFPGERGLKMAWATRSRVRAQTEPASMVLSNQMPSDSVAL
jgi:hypothetical protein